MQRFIGTTWNFHKINAPSFARAVTTSAASSFRKTAFKEVRGIELYSHRKFRPNLVSYGSVDFHDKAHPVFNWTAPSVISSGCEEVTETDWQDIHGHRGSELLWIRLFWLFLMILANHYKLLDFSVIQLFWSRKEFADTDSNGMADGATI